MRILSHVSEIKKELNIKKENTTTKSANVHTDLPFRLFSSSSSWLRLAEFFGKFEFLLKNIQIVNFRLEREMDEDDERLRI